VKIRLQADADLKHAIVTAYSAAARPSSSGDSLMLIREVLDATELENRICLIPSLAIL
jgi:hypothetical protein